MRLYLISICVLSILSSVYAADRVLYPFNSVEQETQFRAILQNVRCVVCQNQNIADSNAPLARDLRTKIYGMVLENASNQQVENYLVKRYGEFILFKPRVNKFTALLWLAPFFSVICAIIMITRFKT